MISIGNAIINEEQIAAIYPSIETPGKIWISLTTGRTVWTMATMAEVKAALHAAGKDNIPNKLAQELAVLEQLADDGYYYIARDETGELWAFIAAPSRGEDCWNAENGGSKLTRSDLFDGVVEWQDDLPSEVDMLIEDMTLHPFRYEE